MCGHAPCARQMSEYLWTPCHPYRCQTLVTDWDGLVEAISVHRLERSSGTRSLSEVSIAPIHGIVTASAACPQSSESAAEGRHHCLFVRFSQQIFDDCPRANTDVRSIYVSHGTEHRFPKDISPEMTNHPSFFSCQVWIYSCFFPQMG